RSRRSTGAPPASPSAPMAWPRSRSTGAGAPARPRAHPSLTPFSGLSYKAAAFHAASGAGQPGRANRRVDGEDGDRAAATPGLGLGGRRPPHARGPHGPSHPPRRPRRDAAPHASLHRCPDRHREGRGLGRPPLLPALRGGARPPAPLLPRAEARPRHQALRHHGHRRRPGVRLARSRHPQVQPPVPRRGRGHLRLRATRVERPVRGHQGGAARPPAHPAPEGFAAVGNKISLLPPIAPGSPWVPGGLGFPNPALLMVPDVPNRRDIRAGARVVATYRDVTYTVAHYYTYLDIPGVRFQIPGQN